MRKTSQIEGNCFPQQGQPVSAQAVSKRQLFINGARASGAGSGQARVTTQLKVQLGTGVCVSEVDYFDENDQTSYKVRAENCSSVVFKVTTFLLVYNVT